MKKHKNKTNNIKRSLLQLKTIKRKEKKFNLLHQKNINIINGFFLIEVFSTQVYIRPYIIGKSINKITCQNYIIYIHIKDTE